MWHKQVTTHKGYRVSSDPVRHSLTGFFQFFVRRSDIQLLQISALLAREISQARVDGAPNAWHEYPQCVGGDKGCVW